MYIQLRGFRVGVLIEFRDRFPVGGEKLLPSHGTIEYTYKKLSRTIQINRFMEGRVVSASGRLFGSNL